MKKQFLKELPLFSHLSNIELDKIVFLLEKESLSKNEVLFQANQPAQKLYFVFDGKIKIFKSSTDGKEHILHIMEKGEIIAEAPMLEGSTYPANAISITAATVFTMSRSSFLKLIKEDPNIMLNILALQAKRLQKFTTKIEKLTLHKLEQRLADYFIQKAENSSIKNVNIQELANYLGATRENISRIISNWKKLNMIIKNSNSIIIVNFKKLKETINKN